jgi:aminoglycoside/choline kinase family phosphotransferase
MQRLEQLKSWLDSLYPQTDIMVEFAAADADFRRYFRAHFPDGTSRIVMDAPPEKMDTDPYVKVREIFSVVNVPQIIARDREQGFMLLEDWARSPCWLRWNTTRVRWCSVICCWRRWIP